MPLIMPTPSPSTVNFDFIDILAHRAYLPMYGGDYVNTAGGSGGYGLLGFAFNSQNIETIKDAEQGAGAFVVKIDADFDLTFNSAQTIEGTAIINFTLGVDGGSIRHRVIIKRVVNSTEYERVNSDYISGDKTGEMCHILTIPKTKFKRGEKLRITVEIGCQGAGAGINCWLAHDPMGRAGTKTPAAQTTVMTAWIPFKLIL